MHELEREGNARVEMANTIDLSVEAGAEKCVNTVVVKQGSHLEHPTFA
jgi:hypothetical protein